MRDRLTQVGGQVITKVSALRERLHQLESFTAATRQGEQQESAAQDALARIREAIGGCRIGPASNQSPVDRLRRKAEQWQGQCGVPARLDVEPSDESARSLEPWAELQLPRIVQEALTNVRKQARATDVTVQLTRLGGTVPVRVVDDGIGFDPGARERERFPLFGLATRQERAEAVGGSLQVSSVPGKGTTVEAVLPVGIVRAEASGGRDASLDRR